MRRLWSSVCVAILVVCVGAVVAPAARASLPDGTQGWYWQMAQPAGTLYGVAFGGLSDAWAVGAGGVILHSSDAGLTWSAQQSGTFADLDSVAFPDTEHGWACGGLSDSINVLVTTSDGGTTWTPETPSVLKGDPVSLSFPDDRHGWLGTDDGHILRTTDGGLSWRTTRLGGGGAELLVDFVDATHGWAVSDEGGTLWSTSNGGATWKALHSFQGPIEQMAVDFVSRSRGWASAYFVANNVQYSTILTTSDGGRVWRTVRRLGGQAVLALQATNASNACFIDVGGGDLAMLSGLPGNSNSMWRTTNGGASWSVQGVGAMVDPWALGGSGQSFCAVGRGILVAPQGGAWQAANSGQLYWLQDGVAVTDSDLWAVDGAGALLHSTDGGTWVEQATPSRWSMEPSGVSFPDSADGWLAGATNQFTGSGVILHTSDGGASWTPQSSVLASGLSGIQFVDDNDGWATSEFPFGLGSGANTAIEHTTDGGSSWIAEYVPDNPSLAALSFTSDTTGWVGGSATTASGAAALFKTTDGGTSWTSEKLPASVQDVSSLQFLDANDGWAVAEGDTTGVLLQTTNGGSTWTTVSSLPAAANPACVYFLNASQGWVGGDGVWATGDGGTSWTEVAGNAGVGSLAATDADHIWAFGDGIVSTVDGPNGGTAPPQTLDDAGWGWHHTSATITLSASDTGSSGVASTQYSTDGGTTWQTGTSIAVPAPADHANDGLHTFLYRSTDTAGNTEATEICGVGIDTLGPACGAPREPVAGTGKSAIIRFKAADKTSGVATAAIRIETRGGRLLRTLVTHSGYWSYGPPAPPYFWLRFTCKLRPGQYRVIVQAVDRAANKQVVVGRSWLRVRLSAPKAKAPDWPAGLPDTTQQGGGPVARNDRSSARARYLLGRF